MFRAEVTLQQRRAARTCAICTRAFRASRLHACPRNYALEAVLDELHSSAQSVLQAGHSALHLQLTCEDWLDDPEVGSAADTA